MAKEIQETAADDRPMQTWRYYSYNVWGNAEEGWCRNDVTRTSVTFEIPEGASDEKILSIVWGPGVSIDRSTNYNKNHIEFLYNSQGLKPAGSLRRVFDNDD